MAMATTTATTDNQPADGAGEWQWAACVVATDVSVGQPFLPALLQQGQRMTSIAGVCKKLEKWLTNVNTHLHQPLPA
jgi:hypothetical protein